MNSAIVVAYNNNDNKVIIIVSSTNNDRCHYSGDHAALELATVMFNTQVSKGRLLETFFFPRDLMYLNTTEGGLFILFNKSRSSIIRKNKFSL